MPPPPPAEWTPDGVPFYKFPPFPQPDPEKVIVKFKDFVPKGIKRSEYEDEQELDACGIATVQLAVKHDNKKTKVSKKRKKNPGGMPPINSEEVKRGGTWYEQWAEAEGRCPLYVRKSDHDAAELTAASIAFMNGRTWFKTNSQLKLSDIYTHWRNFLGLTSSERRKIKGALDAPEAMEDLAFSDDEEEDELPRNAHLTSDEPPEAEEEQDDIDRPADDDKTLAFLANPKLTVEKFFSSFYRAKGLHTPADTLRDGPILLQFWFNFILRSNIFPARKVAPYKSALKVLEVARFELPKMREISYALPDKLSEALFTTFETQDPKRRSDAPPMTWAVDVEGEAPQTVQDSVAQDIAMAEPVEVQASADIDSVTTLDAAPTQTPDGAGLYVAPEDDNDPSNGWGSAVTSGGGGWGGWGVESDTPGDASGMGGWEETTATTTGWDDKPLTLADVIPATAAESFEASYRTGIVERSVRRIKSLIPAGTEGPSLPTEFAKRFARVVLEPWGVYVEGTETCLPEILSTSVGPVVGQSEPEPSATETEADAGVRAHDPLKDDILLFVETKVLEAMKGSEGMGVGATWIQVVPKPNGKVDGEKKKKGKKGSSKGDGLELKPFWYLEAPQHVLPSFHVEL